jgi:hypothetical protein
LGWVLVFRFAVHFLGIGRFQAVYLGSPNQKHCTGASRTRSCYLGVGLPPYQRGDCNVCHRTRQHNQDLEGGVLRMRAPVAFSKAHSSTQQHTAARSSTQQHALLTHARRSVRSCSYTRSYSVSGAFVVKFVASVESHMSYRGGPLPTCIARLGK